VFCVVPKSTVCCRRESASASQATAAPTAVLAVTTVTTATVARDAVTVVKVKRATLSPGRATPTVHPAGSALSATEVCLISNNNEMWDRA